LNDNVAKRTALIISCLGSFMPPFMGSAINLALPSIGREFAMDAVLLGWVATAYLLASAMFILPFGRAADIYGRKKIYTAGIIVFTVGSLLTALSNSVAMLIAFRVVQGIGGSMMAGTAVAILTSVFPPAERGRALGINVATTYTGLSLGPFLGGILTHAFGWRSIFLFTLPFGVLVVVLVFRWLKGEWAGAEGETVDWTGSLVYGVTLVLLIYGLSRLPHALGAVLLLIGVAGAIAFFMLESRIKSPVLNVGIFRHNMVFAFSNLAALIHYSATFAVGFLMSLYLQFIQGMSPQAAGMILVAQPVMMALFSPLAGRLSDRVEPRIVASGGMACTSVAVFLLAFLGTGTGLPFIVACLILLGFGFALFSSPNTNAVMSAVMPRFYGVAAGMLGTMRAVGMMFSMGMAMMIFSLIMGKVQITPEVFPLFMKSVRVAFVIFGVTCVIGTLFSLARGSVHAVEGGGPPGPPGPPGQGHGPRPPAGVEARR
jgi:EmrB/QacA subfamily drug resistance transporter